MKTKKSNRPAKCAVCQSQLFYSDEDDRLSYKTDELYNADPECDHHIVSAPGGGVKCNKCAGWFCY